MSDEDRYPGRDEQQPTGADHPTEPIRAEELRAGAAPRSPRSGPTGQSGQAGPSGQHGPTGQSGAPAPGTPGWYDPAARPAAHDPVATSEFPTGDGQSPPWATAPAWAPAPPPRRRRGLAAAALVGVLALGATAGAGAVQLWGGDDGDSAERAGRSTSAQVVDTGRATVTDGTVESAAQAVLPSVVMISVTTQEGSGSGSGIVLSADGEILTNHHVIDGAEEGGTITVSFNDGTRASAKVVGTDPLTDTALIKAEGVSDLTPATIGKSSNLNVGQQVVAIGSPYGLDATVTSGIVSALNRPVNVGSDSSGNSTTYPAIQTDAAINPGNSGGPLIDLAGHVVGINSSIRTASSGQVQGDSGSIGLGFAIPMDEVLAVVDQMRAGQTVTHARMGISVSDTQQTGAATDVLGALVRSVDEGSGAAKAGLREGDVITRIGDTPVGDADTLVATVRGHRPGDEVEVTWVRDGKERTVSITLDSDEGQRATQTQPQEPQPQQEQEPQLSPEDFFGGR